MPYNINWQEQGIVTKWSGAANSKELIQFLEEMQSNPNFDRLRFSVHDYIQCAQIVFDEDDMDVVGALDGAGSRINPRIKVAIIADQEELREMVIGYKRLGLTPYETRIFHNTTDAYEWINSLGYKLEL